MKWIPTVGHGEITEGISDYSGEEQFLLCGVYIGRGVLRERSGEKMEWKHGYGLQGQFKTGKYFRGGRLKMRILLQGRSEIQDEKKQATR